MTNEYLFFIHSALILAFLLGAIYLGKEAVVAYIAGCFGLANLFVTKQVMLFGFEVTASDAYAIGGMLSISVMQELWGRQAAMKAIFASFLLLSLASIVSIVHVAYIPSVNDSMHVHFEALLSPAPRLAVASFVTFYISSHLEVILFQKLSTWAWMPFAFRAAMSTSLVMLVDTILFSFFGLYGLVADLFDIIIISYLLKLATIALIAPFLSLANKIAAYSSTPKPISTL